MGKKKPAPKPKPKPSAASAEVSEPTTAERSNEDAATSQHPPADAGLAAANVAAATEAHVEEMTDVAIVQAPSELEAASDEPKEKQETIQELRTQLTELQQRLEEAELKAATVAAPEPVAIVGGDTAAELESRLAKISEEKANLEVELDMSKKKFMAAVNKLKKEEKESKETLMRLEAEKDVMRQQLETAGADGTADEEERSTWQCERSALETQVKSLKAQMEEAAGKAEALVFQLDDSGTQLGETRQANAELEAKLARFSQQHDQDMLALKGQQQEERDGADAMQTELTDMISKLRQELKAKASAADAMQAQLEQSVASLTARTEQLSRDNESLQTELTGTKSNADTYAEMVESLKANANQLEQDKLAMEKRLESAGANASSSSNSNANLSEQIATLIKEKDALVHELAESKASAERFAEKADGLTKQVESLSNSNSIAAGHTTVNGKDADAGGVPPAPHVAADLKDEGSDVAVQLDKLALEKQALVKDLEMAKKKFLASAKKKAAEYKEVVAKLQQEKATLEQSLAVVRESFPEMEASMEALQLSEAKAQSDLQEALARECDLQAELETVRGATGGFIRDFPDEPTEGSAEQVKLLEEEKQALQSKLMAEEKRAADLRTELDAMYKREEASKSTIATLEGRAEELGTAKAKLVEEMDTVKKKFMAVAKKKQQEYLAKMKEKSLEVEDAIKQTEAFKLQLDQAWEAKQSLQAQLGEARSQLEAAEAKVQKCTEVIQHLEKEKSEQQKAVSEEQRMVEDDLAMELEEVRAELEEKDRALRESRRLASNQEQMLLEREYQAAEKTAELQGEMELIKKKLEVQAEEYTMQIVELERQCASAISARSQAEQLLAAKEKELNSIEASTSGEQARLHAAVEQLRVEATRKQREHEAEREKVKAALTELKRKAERADRARKKAETQAVESQGSIASERDTLQAMVADNETKLAQLEAQKDRLAAELKDYKVRAHALLKKRDTELHSARDVSVTRAVEEKLKETEAKLARALEERAQGEAALAAATQKAAEDEAEYERREAEMQLVHQDILDRFEAEAASSRQAAEAAEARVAELERGMRLRNGEQDEQMDKARSQMGAELASTKNQLASLQEHHNRLKAEFDSFREIASSMVEAKDREISKILEDTADLRMASLRSQSLVSASKESMASADEFGAAGGDVLGNHGSEVQSQWLDVARIQAGRDVLMSEAEARADELENELLEIQNENARYQEHQLLLKEEVCELQRQLKRKQIVEENGLDMEYLKNIVLKLLQTGEHEVLLPVLAMILKFSPDEVHRCKETYARMFGTPMPEAAAAVDTALASAPKLVGGGIHLLDNVSRSFGMGGSRESK